MNELIRFKDTIIFVDKITHIIKKNTPIVHNKNILTDKYRSNKARDKDGSVLYSTNIKIYLDNGNFIEFKDLSVEETNKILKCFKYVI